MRIAEAVGKCQDVGSRIVPNRVVLIGKEYWDFGDRGPLALADAGCQVALVVLDPEDAEGPAQEFTERIAVIDQVGDDTPRESWLGGIGPLKRRIAAVLGGPPDTVVLGDINDLKVGARNPMQLVSLAPEVVVCGVYRSVLDETVRTLFYKLRRQPVALLSDRATRPRGRRGPSSMVADVLSANGYGRPVSLLELDRWAVRRRRSGEDALAGRSWRAHFSGERHGDCLVADAARLGQGFDDITYGDRQDCTDLREFGIEGVLIDLEQYEGDYDVTGPVDNPDAIRLGVVSDTFDEDPIYEQCAELTCSSGRLFIDRLPAAEGTDGAVFNVTKNSQWIVEIRRLSDIAGVRVRRVDAARDITRVKLRRGMCYGTCPVFDLTLRADGTAIWNGQAWVEPLGEHRGRISAAAFDRVTRKVIENGFDDWPPVLIDETQRITDVPDYELTVARGGVRKHVVQEHPYLPPGFERIAHEMERVVRRLGWSAQEL